MTGLYGKLPAHGDFVRRGLPKSFVGPWDDWLAAGIHAAREALGEEEFAAAWQAAPAWCFALPAGACGPDPVAGVLQPCEDAVGRRFPLTLAALLPEGGPAAEGFFQCLAALAARARGGEADADALAAAIPAPEAAPEAEAEPLPDRPEEGWWTRGTAALPAMVWAFPALPPADSFLFLLDPGAA